MKKCPNCHTYFETKRFTCPLCRTNLEEVTNEEEKPFNITTQDYPSYTPDKRKKNFTMRLFIFLTLIIILVVGSANYLFNKLNTGTWIFLIVIASMLVTWTFVKGIIMSKANFPLRVITFGCCLLGLLMIIEYDLAPTSWVLNYMLSFILVAMLLTIVFAIFIKSKRFKYYISLLIGVSLLNYVPIILFKLQLINISWPASMAFIAGSATLLGIIVFGWKDTLVEIKKRFHA